MELSSLSFDLARWRRSESESHVAMGVKPGETGIFLPLLKQLESCCVGSLTPETSEDYSKQPVTSPPNLNTSSKDGGIRTPPAAKGIETVSDVHVPVSDMKIAELQAHQLTRMPFLPDSGDALTESVCTVGYGVCAAPQIVDWARTASHKVNQTVTSDSGRAHTDVVDVVNAETIVPGQIQFSSRTSGLVKTASTLVSIQITNRATGLALSIWAASEKAGMTPELREALEAEIVYHGCRLAGLQFNGIRSFPRGG